MSVRGAVELGKPWPTLGTLPERDNNPRADVDFEIEFLKPAELRVHRLTRNNVRYWAVPPNVVTAAVLSAPTRYGTFTSVVLLDRSQVEWGPRALVEYLMRIAQELLAEEWPDAAGVR